MYTGRVNLVNKCFLLMSREIDLFNTNKTILLPPMNSRHIFQVYQFEKSSAQPLIWFDIAWIYNLQTP